MARMNPDSIAHDVQMCWDDSVDKTFYLADLLMLFAKGTRWEAEIVSAIEGACPQYFQH